MMIAAMAKVLKHPHARELADLRNEAQAAHAPAYQTAALGVPGHLEGVAEVCLAEAACRLSLMRARGTLGR